MLSSPSPGTVYRLYPTAPDGERTLADAKPRERESKHGAAGRRRALPPQLPAGAHLEVEMPPGTVNYLWDRSVL
jgi:hypothetical protein